MATINSRLDDDGNWVTIESAASGAFSKQSGGEESSPTTAFGRSLQLIDNINGQISNNLTQVGDIAIAYGIKIAPSGEIMITGVKDDCHFQVTYAIKRG